MSRHPNRNKQQKAEIIPVPAMMPGIALQKAKEALESGNFSFHWGHIQCHLDEVYRGHKFETQDVLHAFNDMTAKVTRDREFYHKVLNAFIYDLYGKSADIPIRAVFYFKIDENTGEVLMILTGFIDVPEYQKKIKKY